MFKVALLPALAILSVLTTLFAGPSAIAADEVDPKAGERVAATTEVVSARLKTDLSYLASDELAGRGVGSEGISKAGEFIAARFKELGLVTEVIDSAPFQNFTIPGPTQLAPGDANTLEFSNEKVPGELPLSLGSDFMTLSLGGNGKFSGQVAFVGYGITADEYRYDDYSGLDVKGKVVIALRKEPQQQQADSRFAGTQNSQYAFFTSKELNAAVHGVAALILVNDAATVTAATEQARKDLAAAEASLAAIEQTPAPTDPQEAERYERKKRIAVQQVDELKSRLSQGEIDTLLGVNEGGNALKDLRVPTFFATRAVVDKLLSSSLGRSLLELETEIDRSGQPQSSILPGVRATGQAEIARVDIPVRNVFGVLPGNGPLAEEFVVVGAHYDHVGMGGMGSLAPGTIAVHNGADDNGSGTVTMLEIAAQLAARSEPNRRTIIFMAFTGEESGLLGSAHYVRNPRWALEKTVAMVNLDMVGRLNNNELTVYGTGTARGFSEQIDRLGSAYKFRVVKVPQGRGASDHANFYDAKIPVFHFFTGLHNEYHRPSDDVELINFEGMTRISMMVSDLVKEIAASPERPPLQMIEGAARPRSQGPSAPRRAVLGIRLESDANAPAVLQGIMADGPAAKSILLQGDRIIQLGDQMISNVGDLRAALAKLKPGMTVAIKAMRGDELIQTEIGLSE